MGVGGLLQPEPCQAPGLGEQAFPKEFEAHDGVRDSCVCSWVSISGATVGRKGNLLCFGLLLELELLEFGGDGGRGSEGHWGWGRWQVGLVASISCITGRTWSFLVVSNHQIWTDFQGACKKRFPHSRLLSLPSCGDCCKLLSSIKDFISA